MEANALVDTQADKIANQVQKFYNTVGDMKAEVLVFKVASRIAVLSGKPHEDMLTKAYVQAMVNTLAGRLAHLQMQTIGKQLGKDLSVNRHSG